MIQKQQNKKSSTMEQFWPLGAIGAIAVLMAHLLQWCLMPSSAMTHSFGIRVDAIIDDDASLSITFNAVVDDGTFIWNRG